MKLSGIGEFGLIDRLSRVLGPPSAPGLLLGIGDDAAAWRPTPGCVTVSTADALVEGVHFDLATTSWSDLGWKALAENVSDIAAMGCEPRYALVALALPRDTGPADVEALYGGMRECADAYGCAVVGGDVVSAPTVMISVSLIGESLPAEGEDEPPLLTRSAARPGDALAVTGPLGASAAGLQILARATGPNNSALELAAATAHRRPTPRVAAGLALVRAGVRCAIDISDGLIADVGHICERSGVDALIDADRVPLHPAAEEVFADAALEVALTGGEDYELACAAPRAVLLKANELLRAAGEPELTIIGEIIQQQGGEPEVRVRNPAGETMQLGETGYQHFSSHQSTVSRMRA
jgi:thiamine-monophosphate kinase